MSNREPFTVLQNPTVEKAVTWIKAAFAKRNVLLLVGNCIVDYRGRANSKLGYGERIAVFKTDGSVLIHRPIGYEPVNWQPPGCIFHVKAVDDLLQIKAVRRKPAELLKMTFQYIYLLSVLKLVDEGEFALHASEADMQKAILVMPSLIEDGLKPIAYEKNVDPGFVDVYCEDKAGKLVVIEIKRRTASKQAALQLAKYVKTIRSMVNRDVRGLLTAPNLGKDVQRLLITLGLEFKTLHPRKCAKVLNKLKTKQLQEFFTMNTETL